MLIQVSMDNGTSLSDLMFYLIQQKYMFYAIWNHLPFV